MTVKDLEDLYDYGYWADRKLFDVITKLTPEEFTRSVAGSYESVRNTMVHIMGSITGDRSRCYLDCLAARRATLTFFFITL
jgi:uncharacterized damage-inducible protein DinB